MKKIIFSILLCLFCTTIYAQNVIKEGNTFKKEIKTNRNTTKNKTIYFWEDSKGIKYPIYLSKNNACYIKKISKKTGKEYKYYLDKEISKQIIKQISK
jgi:hypothetical protein